MTPGFPELLDALPVPPATNLRLRRLVSRDALYGRGSPDFLYTTGYAYRVNTSASRALYGAEDAATAGAEWERQASQSPRLISQVLYFVELTLPLVDLGNEELREALHLSESDLREPWMLAPIPTRLQTLGDAVARQRRFGGIRFPSDAARERGFRGFNVALYPSAIVSPMSVVIRDDTGSEVQRWPAT